MFNHLLVVLSQSSPNDMALKRAVLLAEQNNASLTIFKSFYKQLNNNNDGPEIPDDLAIFVREQQRIISSDFDKTAKGSLTPDIVISWQSPSHIAIKEHIENSSVDLIVKTPSKKKRIAEFFTTGLDHFLIRDCNSAIWMVNNREWDESVEILTCLDIGDETNANVTLNHSIMEVGDFLTKHFNGEHHIIDCYFGDNSSMAIEYTSKNGFKTDEHLDTLHRDKLTTYIKNYNIDEQAIHIVAGVPDSEIPLKAKSLEAEITVIGNNKDTNILDRTFGDTAKHLTDHIPCDIFILKP